MCGQGSKHHISRRDFLGGALGLTVASLLPNAVFAKGPENLASRPILFCGSGKGAAALLLETDEVKHIPLSFSPHSFIYHEQTPNSVLATEKGGTHSALIDIQNLTVIEEFNSPSGTQFYGHGLYNAKGDTFFLVRVDENSGKGSLVGYDPRTLKEQRVIEVTPGGLHDCKLLKDGTVLIASTGFRTGAEKYNMHEKRITPSALIHVDLDTGEILNTQTIDEPGQMIAHFGISTDDEIVALTSPLKEDFLPPHGSLYYTKNSEPLKKIEFPEELKEKLRGEMLSISFDSKNGHAFVTNPIGEIILKLTTKDGALVDYFESSAFGVSYNPKNNQLITSSPKGFQRLTPKGDVLKSNLNDDSHADTAHSLLII